MNEKKQHPKVCGLCYFADDSFNLLFCRAHGKNMNQMESCYKFCYNAKKDEIIKEKDRIDTEESTE